eukprot:TRINITY_DN4310_c0_g1_i15.p1 TRINITY_DN4310_c0_g1~~TRINITY_DN4310_c0_g1_i15.p1  ORF type:complete len:285 (-),score=62.95 TRINITY_DN4310_c0_g1_i15:124-978(-)
MSTEIEFELQDRLLGEGSFSKVFLAKNTQTNELVAAKTIDIKKYRHCYEREIKALTAIYSQPQLDDAVIPLLQYGEDGETGYLFTPYYSCGTLQDYLDSKHVGLTLLETLEIFENILRAVVAIHKANFIHSDLKPDNILFNPITKQITIFDFGLSLEMDENHNVRNCCGSPLFMAPEVIGCQNAEEHDGILSEIWSLGIILYYLVFSEFPWRDISDIDDLVDAILDDEVYFPKQSSLEVENLITWMLEKDPMNRPSLHQVLMYVKKSLGTLKKEANANRHHQVE